MQTDLTPDLIRRILRLWEADPELRPKDDPYGLVYESGEWYIDDEWQNDVVAAALITCRLMAAADALPWPDGVQKLFNGSFEWVRWTGGRPSTGRAPTRLAALVALHEARLGIGEEMNNANSL